MPTPDQLSERELRVLEAVVQTYIETAEPAGSQTIARRYGLGLFGELDAFRLRSAAMVSMPQTASPK